MKKIKLKKQHKYKKQMLKTINVKNNLKSSNNKKYIKNMQKIWHTNYWKNNHK